MTFGNATITAISGPERALQIVQESWDRTKFRLNDNPLVKILNEDSCREMVSTKPVEAVPLFADIQGFGSYATASASVTDTYRPLLEGFNFGKSSPESGRFS